MIGSSQNEERQYLIVHILRNDCNINNTNYSSQNRQLNHYPGHNNWLHYYDFIYSTKNKYEGLQYLIFELIHSFLHEQTLIMLHIEIFWLTNQRYRYTQQQTMPLCLLRKKWVRIGTCLRLWHVHITPYNVCNSHISCSH